ncbi:thiamine pyrophosphate-binding protein [Desulforamulus ruminis]|uniref:thiamine pyrophosphate-binding protein n=1 Tax=Desulforamulus ruminis TaxID=1564 RepID=UPI002FD8E3DD
MAKTVAQVMVDQLVNWGVKQVFGVVGDGIFHLLDALAHQPKIHFYAVRHEETAALMASAYAKLTGQVAVCTATSGPGLVHLLNGLADAQKDGVPVVAITGQVARKDMGTRKKQYIDQQTLVQPLVSYSTLLADPQATVKLMDRAFRSALSKRMAAHLCVPLDVFPLPCLEEIRPPEPYLFTETRSNLQVVKEAAKIFDQAQKPVILAGAGARKAVQPLRELAEKWGAGVIHTLGGMGVFPGDHPLALGGLGHAGSSSAEAILKQADVCFRVGVNWWPEDYIPQNITVIELDHEPANIGGSSPADYGLAGKAENLLPEITSFIQPAERKDWSKILHKGHLDWHLQVQREANGKDPRVPPAKIVQSLGEVVAAEAVICLDTGDHTIWFGRNFIPQEQRILLSGKWRTMGFGLPAALAAKIAEPNRQVTALVGDGGMGMLLADFTTAVKYNLPVMIVVVNNGGLIEEKNRMMVGNLIPHGVYLHNPDFAAFAKACGGEGFTVENADELRAAFLDALHCGKPAIVDVRSGDPMIPGTKMN